MKNTPREWIRTDEHSLEFNIRFEQDVIPLEKYEA